MSGASSGVRRQETECAGVRETVSIIAGVSLFRRVAVLVRSAVSVVIYGTADVTYYVSYPSRLIARVSSASSANSLSQYAASSDIPSPASHPA